MLKTFRRIFFKKVIFVNLNGLYLGNQEDSANFWSLLGFKILGGVGCK